MGIILTDTAFKLECFFDRGIYARSLGIISKLFIDRRGQLLGPFIHIVCFVKRML
ncbi:hypothetical protein D3C72_2192690 [compost metagenome]